MSNNNQTPEEMKAQHEANAEKEFNELAAGCDPVDSKRALGERIVKYAHSQLMHFMQVDTDLAQGLITFEGVPYICSFHRTVEDLIEDTRRMDIASVEFVGSTDINEELAHRNDLIMLVAPFDMDAEDDDD